MKSPRSSLTLVAVAGLLSTGATPWGTGGTGHNGLDPAVYHADKMLITKLMGAALPNGPTGVPPFTSTPAGITLLRDAIGCATTSSRSYAGHAFPGQGLLKLGDDWGSHALNPQEIDDVHTCLIARMNAFDVEVPIFLFGPRVRKTFSTFNAYPYAEAVWLATVADNTVKIDVWPLEKMHACWANRAEIKDAIQLRVCGGSSVCGLTVHSAPSDLATFCDNNQDGDGWWCTTTAGAPKKRPAIATRLGPCAWKQIYKKSPCSLPAGIVAACAQNPGGP